MPQPSFPLDCAKQLGDAELTVKLFIETVGYGMWRRSTSLVKYYGATVGPIPILFAIAIRDLDALRNHYGGDFTDVVYPDPHYVWGRGLPMVSPTPTGARGSVRVRWPD